MKYKETKNYQSLFLKVISGQKWPWISKIFEGTIRFLFTPFRYIKPIRKWMSNTYGGANGKIFRLVREQKYEEGYIFGVERLKDWLTKMPKSGSVSQVALYTTWWFGVSSVCRCAMEINNEQAYSVLSELVEKGPEPGEDYPVAESYYYLSQLAYKKGNNDKAWDWIERSIKCDDSYGWSYHFRAWLGIILGKGQPLEDLVMSLKLEPEFKTSFFEDETFKRVPGLLDDLKTKLTEETTTQ